MRTTVGKGVALMGKQSGVSMVEIFVGASILAGILLISAKIMTRSGMMVNRSKYMELVERTRMHAGTLGDISASAAHNAVLANCIVAKNCASGWTPFDLYRANGVAPIAGTGVFFNTKTTSPCVPGTSDCNLSLAAEYRASASRIETRIILRHTADPNWKAITSPSTSLDLQSSPDAKSCPPHSAVVGVNQDGSLNCSENTLPAGGGVMCPGGSGIRSLDQDGSSACVPVVPSVDTTNNPSGFFVNKDSQKFGTYGWGDCALIMGLNKIFPNTRTNFTCNWQSNGPCTKIHGYRFYYPCSCCSGDPVVCTPCTCSYCVSTGSSSPTCTQTSTASRSGGPGGFDCDEVKPGAGNCNNVWSEDCQPLSCPEHKLVSHSGDAQCLR